MFYCPMGPKAENMGWPGASQPVSFKSEELRTWGAYGQVAVLGRDLLADSVMGNE